MTPEIFLIASPKKHVISTEGGAFAAAGERPLYFKLSTCHNLQGAPSLAVSSRRVGSQTITPLQVEA